MGLWNGIGNGIGRKKSGINWSSYWTQLISATVENAAPTDVVLTFPTAQTSLTDADFTIAGFTISSASWTGAVLTLVLSTDVLIFDGDLTVTFVKTGTTATVTNNVTDDGHTVAWYDSQDLSTITKDGSDLVSLWKDKLLSGHDLAQATGTLQPTWILNDGFLFDGADNFLKAATFNLDQPCFIYIVGKQITWVFGNRWFDGHTQDSVILNSRPNDATLTQIAVYAGAYSASAYNIQLDTNYLVKMLFNGASSKFQVDNEPEITGDFGANDLDGFTLASSANGATPSNIQVKEIIIRDSADDAATELKITNYLKTHNGLDNKRIAFVGDSTMGLYTVPDPDLLPVASYVYFADNNRIKKNIAVQGDFIADQKTLWSAITYKTVVDVVFMLIGLNDVETLPTAQVIAAYQDLVDTIRADIGVSGKIVGMTLIPCSRATDQQWTDLNEAIRGDGASPITGLDAVIDTVTTALNNGDDTLAAAYDSGDHLHENTAGRQLLATLIEAQLTTFGI